MDPLVRKEGDKETVHRTLSSNHDKPQPSCAWTQNAIEGWLPVVTSQSHPHVECGRVPKAHRRSK